MTTRTDDTAGNPAALVAITAACTQLGDSIAKEPELPPKAALLEQLAADDGPLSALIDLFRSIADSLTDYEVHEIDLASDRAADAAQSVAEAIYNARLVLRLIRPHAGADDTAED